MSRAVHVVITRRNTNNCIRMHSTNSGTNNSCDYHCDIVLNCEKKRTQDATVYIAQPMEESCDRKFSLDENRVRNYSKKLTDSFEQPFNQPSLVTNDDSMEIEAGDGINARGDAVSQMVSSLDGYLLKTDSSTSDTIRTLSSISDHSDQVSLKTHSSTEITEDLATSDSGICSKENTSNAITVSDSELDQVMEPQIYAKAATVPVIDSQRNENSFNLQIDHDDVYTNKSKEYSVNADRDRVLKIVLVVGAVVAVGGLAYVVRYRK